MAKYFDEYVCICVCLSVCLSVCPPGYLRNHTHDLYHFSVHAAYGRGSVLWQGDEITRGRGSFGGFSYSLTMHCNTFAAKGIIRSPITLCSRRDHSVTAAFVANGIGQEGGNGSTSAGKV